MKSLTDVVVSILHDCGMLCGVNPLKDAMCIRRRAEDEGESFLTITLPTFSDALEKGLREGHWPQSLSSTFQYTRGRRLPTFLSGFSGRVFGVDGDLLVGPDVSAIRAIRQTCRIVGRLFASCGGRRTRCAGIRFVELDEEIGRDGEVPPNLAEMFDKVSAVVWGDIVGGPASAGLYDNIVPRHGPGTTAEGIRGNLKYDFRSWPQRLERVLPFAEFGISSILNDDGLDRVTRISYPSPRDEPPVKVAFVPKTAKKPRVIAIEPVAMQYMQQAFADWLRDPIEKRSPFTRGHVNFRDQTVNANFARTGSRDGKTATLDLSDASDRVSCTLVNRMLKSVPEFRRYVFATRSSRASMPDGKIVHLRKFASMGSAMCFPIEAMVFYLIMVTSRLVHFGMDASPREIYLVSRGLYVYGDDLIVPTDEAPSIVASLEAFGLKVNIAKSFWTGRFRESCGSDYYDGENVTPVYLRRNLPSDRTDVHGLVSLVSFTNQLYWAGYWTTAAKLRELTESLVGKLPSIATHMQVLGWHSISNAITTHAWDEGLQRTKTRCLVPTPKRSADPLEGDAALLKCWRTIGIEESPVSLEHLLTSVRSGDLALKRRWI